VDIESRRGPDVVGTEERRPSNEEASNEEASNEEASDEEASNEEASNEEASNEGSQRPQRESGPHERSEWRRFRSTGPCR
jgi:hypothetical protein